MADTKLSALSAAAALGDTDLFYTVQSSTSLKATGAQLKTYMSAGLPSPLIVRQIGGVVGTDEVSLAYSSSSGALLTSGFTAIYFRSGAARFWFSDQTNATYYATISPTQICTSLAGAFCWANVGVANPDTGLVRVAAGVVGPSDGGATANTWFQNTGGEACLAAVFTNATATLAPTALASLPLTGGRSYRIEGLLQVSNTVAAEGVQFNFNGGTATATTFFVAAQAVGSVTAGTLASTTLAGVLNYTVVTGTDYILISGFIKVNAGGTVILQAAENSHATGTLTLGAGSWLAFYDTVPK